MYRLNLGKFEAMSCDIQYETSVFPNGEIFFRLKDKPEPFVQILTRLNSSEEIIRLVMATDALRRAGARRIKCVVPYFPYGQQDRVCNAGESHSLRVFGELINSLKFEEVIVHDPHSNVIEAVVDNLTVVNNSQFIDWVLMRVDGPLNIIVPDQGAAKKIYGLSNLFKNRKTNLVICTKDRNLQTTEIIKTTVPKIDNDWDCLIIDDLCLAGGTFIAIAEEIKKVSTNNYHMYLATTHGVYNKGFETLKNYFDKLYCTNSVKDIDNKFVEQYWLY